MKNLFAPYQPSLDMRDLGFDEPCITSYDTEGKLRNPFDYNNSEYNDNLNRQSYFEDAKHFVQNSTINKESGFIAAPMYEQAFRWFREKYNCVCEIIRKEVGNHSEFIGWVYIDDRKIDVVSYWDSKSYEEAQLECLKKLIQIIKEKN